MAETLQNYFVHKKNNMLLFIEATYEADDTIAGD
jgi:hypothetical protein